VAQRILDMWACQRLSSRFDMLPTLIEDQPFVAGARRLTLDLDDLHQIDVPKRFHRFSPILCRPTRNLPAHVFRGLILEDEVPIELSGFTLTEVDQILMDDEPEAIQQGPLAPDVGAVAVARLGDVFQLGPHRVICGDATDPAVLSQLMDGEASARLILTDQPYNVKIAGNVTGGAHREFAMASGEMTDGEFLAFNIAWMEAALAHLCDGGVWEGDRARESAKRRALSMADTVRHRPRSEG